MIPITKKNAPQDTRAIVTIVVSLLYFLPLPVHISPIGLMVWGVRSKVRLWFLGGLFFTLAELALLAAALWVDKTYSQHDNARSAYMMTIFLGWIGCYVFTNLWLLFQAKNHFYRLYLSKTKTLGWSNWGREINVAPEPAMEDSEAFIRILLLQKDEIENTAIKSNIDRMVSLFRIIAKKDKAAAEKFLVTHSTVVNVLTQYDEIENTRLHNEVTIESKKQLESVIEKAALAFEQELTNRFKTEIMEVSAETDAYLQQLKNKNLIQ